MNAPIATRPTAAQRFDQALPLVQSTSIREWAHRNRAAWLAIINSGSARLAGERVETPESLAAYIVCTAIGA